MFDFSILRQLRKKNALSIGELAEASGVSVSVISKLERNQTRAELDTLSRLARVFGVSAAELLNLAETRPSCPQTAREHRSEDFLFEEIDCRNARLLHGRAPAGARVSRPRIHRDDYELCWVLGGRLRISLPSETHELAPGESLQFDALLEHTYEALTECEILIVHLRKENRF